MGSEIMRGRSTASLLLGFYILMNLMVQDVCAAFGIAPSCVIVFFPKRTLPFEVGVRFRVSCRQKKALMTLALWHE